MGGRSGALGGQHASELNDDFPVDLTDPPVANVLLQLVQ